MQYQYFLIFALLFCSATTSTITPLQKIIKLTVGASQAAYLPLANNRWLQNGHIIENPTSLQPLVGYKPDKDKISCSVGGWKGKSHSTRDTELFLFMHPEQKLAVFGFRGTEPTNAYDWLQNFKMTHTQVNIGSTSVHIHKGFSARYLDISPWFEAEYQAIPRDYKILITGHSLGGALATLAGAYASAKLKRLPDAVVPYASPLVGQRDFRDLYHNTVGCDRTLRITTKDDFITTVPPMRLRYMHVCSALEVDGHTSPLGKFDLISTHDIYGAL